MMRRTGSWRAAVVAWRVAFVSCAAAVLLLGPSAAVAQEGKAAAQEVRPAEPASPDLYVGGWQVNHEFAKVTDQCMETLRTKKVLVLGMSYSLSTVNGIADLGRLDKKYAMKTGKKTDFTPADFDAPVFFRADRTKRYPYTQRVEDLDGWIRKDGYDKILDGAFVVWHNMSLDGIVEAKKGGIAGVRKVYDVYSATFDKLRKDYPRLTMIYCMPGILPTKDSNTGARQHYGNVLGLYFNSMVSDNYLGDVPLYDMESFLNTDANDRQNLIPFEAKEGMDLKYPYGPFRGIDVPRRFDVPAMCEDYVAGDRLHGWNKVGSPRFGRAILLTMAKAWCPDAFPKPQYPQKTLPKYPSTILKMSFDGDLLDVSGNKLAVGLFKGRSGVPQASDEKEMFAPGVSGKGLALFKVRDIYPVVANHEMLNGMEKLHVSVQARRRNGYGWGALLYKQDQFEVRLFDGEVRGFLRTVKEQAAFRGKAPQDDKWHKYELAYDGNNLTVTVDGEKVFEQKLSGAVHSTPHPLFIGKKGPFGYTFDGEMDEMELK